MRLSDLASAALAALLSAVAPPVLAGVDDATVAASRPPKLLSGFGFFEDLPALEPASDVVPYQVTSPLFTDYAAKSRWIYTPSAAAYRVAGVLDFPVGAALIKTFSYGDRKVETRVLLHRENGWAAYPYVWNTEGTEATLKVAGKDIELDTGHGRTTYHVPNVNQCKSCHIDAQGAFRPIGPKIRNLNIPGQLERLVAAGVITETRADAPATVDFRDASLPLEDRARAYLDANCAHCHAPGLPADTSGLYLDSRETRAIHLGVGKKPVAAGRGSGGLKVAIAPGDPDASILLFRMRSTDPGVMMPEIGRSLVDAEGVALIRDWIAALK